MSGGIFMKYLEDFHDKKKEKHELYPPFTKYF